MRRASSTSSTGSLSTPVAASSWSSQRSVAPEKASYSRASAVLAKMRRIEGMPAFEELAARPSEELPAPFQPTLDVVPPGEELDAVSMSFRSFRMGGPLTLVYNTLHTDNPLAMISPSDALDSREVKRSIYHFISASAKELEVKSTGDHFMVTQVFGNAVGDIIRPSKIVEISSARSDPASADSSTSSASTVLASPRSTKSQSSGVTTSKTFTMPNSAAAAPTAREPPTDGSQSHNASRAPSNASTIGSTIGSTMMSPTSPHMKDDSPVPQDQRSKVVDELSQTERKYVRDLEVSQQFHDEMITIGIPRETAAIITPGLAKSSNFQRRFLVGCEYQIRKADAKDQNFGWSFSHSLEGFEIYKTYTLGQKEAMQTAMSETTALMPSSHILEPMYELPSTSLKPVQRILRYPLSLKEILKKTPADWPHYGESQSASDAMQESTADVNETQRKAENFSVTSELQEKVRDWKSLDIGSSGELSLSGVFPVSNTSEVEQEYHVYAFARCIVFFRDRVASKKTPLTKMRPAANARNSQVKSVSLESRGRVYIKYITSSTTTKSPTAGYSMRINWGNHNDASEHGYLDVRLVNEEMAQSWEQTISKQRAKSHDEVLYVNDQGQLIKFSNSSDGMSSHHRGSDGSISPNNTGSSATFDANTSFRSSRSGSVSSLSYNARSSQTSSSQLHRWPTAGNNNNNSNNSNSNSNNNNNDSGDRRSFLGGKRSSSSSIHLANALHRNSSSSNSGSNSSHHSNVSNTTGNNGSHAANGHPNNHSALGNASRSSSNINDISLPEDVMPVQFWGGDLGGNSSSQATMDASRKLSVSSVNSQQSFGMGSTTSVQSINTGGAARSSSSLPYQQQQSGFSQQAASSSQMPLHFQPQNNASGAHKQKPSDSTSSLHLPGQRKVRIHTEGDTFLLLVTPDVHFESLAARVQRKSKLCGKLDKLDPAVGLRFQYVDEDNDFVRLESDDDLLVAFDSVPVQNELSIYVNI